MRHSSHLVACVCLPVLVAVSVPLAAGEPAFRRGDSNADSEINLTDAVSLLLSLFRGAGPLPCDDAADADDDGQLLLTDAIYVLGYLFRGGAQPPAPGLACGQDPTTDPLGCASYPSTADLAGVPASRRHLEANCRRTTSSGPYAGCPNETIVLEPLKQENGAV